MKTNKDLTIIKEAEAITKAVPVLAITDTTTLTRATETLSLLNGYLDRVVADREKITKPLNQSLREIRAKYKPTEDALKNAIDDIRLKMSEYQTRDREPQCV